MQRSKGKARLSVKNRDGLSCVANLYQEGAAKIRLPKTHSGNALDAVLINTSGGMTDGDRFEWSIDIETNAKAIVTNQACEKVYRARTGDTANVKTDIHVASGAAFSWLPQETILFNAAALTRQLTVHLADDARFLCVEPLIFGRHAMGETVHDVLFRDRWRIFRAERLLHAEDSRFEGTLPPVLHRQATTNGHTALASLVMVHPHCGDMVSAVRQMLNTSGGASAIESSAGSRMVIRMTAQSGLALRKQLVPVIDWCNAKIIGPGHGLPKLWNI